MRVIYPAVFHHEDNSYWVEFPDLQGCQSFGDTIAETLEGAKEALCGYCVVLLEQNKPLPKPTNIEVIKTNENEFVSLIDANLIDKSKCIKKTLTIPSWLNDIAIQENLNFSNVLQNALMERLHISGK